MLGVLLLAALVLPASAHADCKSGPLEPFGQFIEAFGNDKSFAKTRTEYPLTLLSLEDDGSDKGGRAIVEKRISKKDDAAGPAMAAFARDNGRELSTTSVQKSEAVVRMAIPGSDWLLTYHFVRKNACWYLRRIEDHSL